MFLTLIISHDTSMSICTSKNKIIDRLYTMGSTKSKLKTSSSNVEDFNKLKIPDTHILIKISTYCVNVGNSVGLKHKIKEIISYIDTKIKNKKIDILCLQGIKDKVSANTLVRSI